MNEEFNEWLDTRPQVIKDLVAKYPPFDKYIIRKGAPYAISREGTIVSIQCYFESGDVGVVVMARDKTKEAIDHEIYIGKTHNRSDEDIENFAKENVMCQIDPVWLKPLFSNN